MFRDKRMQKQLIRSLSLHRSASHKQVSAGLEGLEGLEGLLLELLVLVVDHQRMQVFAG